ncbi:hypothetical protein BH20ACT24_BH20ACT24_07180 [soil metagenome]
MSTNRPSERGRVRRCIRPPGEKDAVSRQPGGMLKAERKVAEQAGMPEAWNALRHRAQEMQKARSAGLPSRRTAGTQDRTIRAARQALRDPATATSVLDDPLIQANVARTVASDPGLARKVADDKTARRNPGPNHPRSEARRRRSAPHDSLRARGPGKRLLSSGNAPVAAEKPRGGGKNARKPVICRAPRTGTVLAERDRCYATRAVRAVRSGRIGQVP